jgi:solute carrier family 25 thiamine pyrophosphate transporter 19
MISGALSGFVSKTVIYPFDLVRKRLQVQGQTTEPWLRCLKSIVVKEGFKSLYKGLAPSLLKVAPANAVTFMVFEETKDLILLFKDNNPRCAT